MTLEELKEIDARCRRKDPSLFENPPPDPPASEQQLEAAERAIGVRLPRSYRSFLKEFGGGHFGLLVVFSANPDSEWYLPKKQREAALYLPDGLVAFSDDFAGGNYVFKVVNGEAQEAVFYWNTDGGETSTEFNDIIEFTACYAYDPA